MYLPGTEPGTVFVATARVELYVPEAGSLKGKRKVLNRTKASLRDELEVSVAEVGFAELWQRAALGVAAAASSAAGAQRILDRVPGVIERDPRVIVTAIITDVDEIVS